MTQESAPLPPAIRRLVALVEAAKGGLTCDELAVELSAQTGTRQDVRRLAPLIATAVSAGVLVEGPAIGREARRLQIPSGREAQQKNIALVQSTKSSEGGSGLVDTELRCVRVVIVDLESAVRTVATEPYIDKRIYQIGALRTGTDVSWTEVSNTFTVYVELPDETWEIHSDSTRTRYENEKVELAQALEALCEFCDGADLIVAHNGVEADFPLLKAAFERESMPVLDANLVDAYYIFLAVWPTAPTYRLAELADNLGVDRTGLKWHDALADCVLLERVLCRAVATVVGWDTDLVDLIASVCPDSMAWQLVRALAGAAKGLPAGHLYGQRRNFEHADVSRILAAYLRSHQPRRSGAWSSGNQPGHPPLEVPADLRDAHGRVDPVLLAAIVHQRKAEPRPAQQRMTTALHDWIDAGEPALVEAPTGTGKSLAILAAVLDWLAGSPTRTAIVTTFTKQLQAQLAKDVEHLNTAIPGFLECGDLVKGAANRLSLRALTVILSDATTRTETAASRNRSSRQARFLSSQSFRELAIYVVLRLLEATSTTDRWAAHSVDPVDIPAFFNGYCGRVLPVWLTALSQSGNGDYTANTNMPLAAHTDFVREALGSHRLLLANHALLLAHLNDLSVLGPDTLLVVDEAHQLEDAATSALTTALDYQAVEDLYGDLKSWLGAARNSSALDSVASAVSNLDKLLDHEHLPKLASQVFDARGGGTGSQVGSRSVTLASAYSGSVGTTHVRALAARLVRLAGLFEALVGALGAYRVSLLETADVFETERIKALIERCKQTQESAQILSTHTDEILQRTGVTAAGGHDAVSEDEHASELLEADEDIQGDLLAEVEATRSDSDEATEDAERSDGAAEASWHGSLPPGTSNHVIYAEELAELYRSSDLRAYKFRIASSPVELPENDAWRQFLRTFARSYFISATLRVAGSWEFIRNRLGLPSAIHCLHLPTPFDLGKQCEVVCFSDFPSWAEQSEGAMRTVAHQLAGYVREVVRPRVSDTGDEDGEATGGTGFDHGVMVLTTARSTSGGITDYLAGELRKGDDGTPVVSALELGNPRAVQQFTGPDGGGILVGTKGLWQGVDVADERRLSLVWINKLPFAPFAAPVIEARRAAVTARADAAHAPDPDAVATESYYLPLAALQLQQAIGRLIRSERHRGVVIISDRKLGGQTALRRAYRRTFLGSLDPGVLIEDPRTGEVGGGNVVTMHEGWTRTWRFFARQGFITNERLDELLQDKELEQQVQLPQTLRIRELKLTPAQVQQHLSAGTLEDELVKRAAAIGGLLNLSDQDADLKAAQQQVIRAVAQGRDVLGLLPTGFGKSFCFQLPALVLPGVTIVISPLVALMQDQALELNRSIGGAVRALVAPMRESSSRTGKTEVAEQLLGHADHGIRMIYVSPERLCQRRFRDVVRQAVAEGTVTRIALDEAHTFIQWDDFRPSMSRVEQYLAQLRRDYGLRITALTATANRTVLAGLRQGVFGLAGEALGGAAGERAEAAAGGLVTIRENPIRPELAIFRRSIPAAGPVLTARLAEEVLSALDDHAIFYCLTVREVVALHAHLREHLGAAGTRVLRFHGRLTEVEKSAVLNEFREAARKGEEGFVPLVVVATAAFGLGINRPDIRTVFCVSAPTDLAALYQQIGRAGRDAAGQDQTKVESVGGNGGGTPPPAANVALTLMTRRALSTVRFMTCNDLKPPVLRRMARAVLESDEVLDTAKAADEVIAEHLARGILTLSDAQSARTAETYRAGIMRALAALAELDAVEDLGDFPPLCAVKPGELTTPRFPDPKEPDQDALELELVEDAVVDAVLKLPARDAPAGVLVRRRLDVVRLDKHLARHVPGFRDLAEDPAGTWQVLADLHDRGRLDVSAAPSRGFVTGLRVLDPVVPDGYDAAVSGKAARARKELALLEDFFADERTCANDKLAAYFDVEQLPPGCCGHARNRCSACWNRKAWPPMQGRPASAESLDTPTGTLKARLADTSRRQRRLDDQIDRLIWDVHRGVHPADLCRALRGEDSRFVPVTRRRVPLRPALLASRYFGADPTVRLQDVQDALMRLATRGAVVQSGALWRHGTYVKREQEREVSSTASSGRAETVL